MSKKRIAGHAAEVLIVLSALAVGAMLLHRTGQDASDSDVPAPVSAFDTTGVMDRVVLIYIGDADCGACTNKEFKEALDSFVSGMRSYVESQGLAFHSIGTIMTRDLPRASSYFSDLSHWNELSLGGGWLNSTVQAQVWETGATPATPTIVVLLDEVRRAPGLPGSLMFTSHGNPLVVTGSAQIQEIVKHEDWSRALPDRTRASH